MTGSAQLIGAVTLHDWSRSCTNWSSGWSGPTSAA
jgi:hypothetical protein